jgi:chemotaxis protein MotB
MTISKIGVGGSNGAKALEEAHDALASALSGTGLSGSVSMRVEARGLVVSIVSDRVLFDPGEAELRAEGHQIIDRLGPVLARMPNALSIEGHTDNVPISGRFPSNWELSSARASSVLHELTAASRLAPSRFTVIGYADQRPVAKNTTAAGRSANRRVEIVVLAQQPSAVTSPTGATQ